MEEREREKKISIIHVHFSSRLPVNQIIPETYRLDIQSEREEFFRIYIGMHAYLH